MKTNKERFIADVNMLRGDAVIALENVRGDQDNMNMIARIRLFDPELGRLIDENQGSLEKIVDHINKKLA